MLEVEGVLTDLYRPEIASKHREHLLLRQRIDSFGGAEYLSPVNITRPFQIRSARTARRLEQNADVANYSP